MNIAKKKKTIETRTWNTKFRGTFYIHASKGIDKELAKRLKLTKFTTGAIIGKATLVDVKHYKNEKEFQKDNNISYIVATDGFRLSLLKYENMNFAPLLVSSHILAEVSRLLKEKK